jgi:hypothetical protein
MASLSPRQSRPLEDEAVIQAARPSHRRLPPSHFSDPGHPLPCGKSIMLISRESDHCCASTPWATNATSCNPPNVRWLPCGFACNSHGLPNWWESNSCSLLSSHPWLFQGEDARKRDMLYGIVKCNRSGLFSIFEKQAYTCTRQADANTPVFASGQALPNHNDVNTAQSALLQD